MTLFLHAWRNLWRNKRRTAITLAAVSLNTAVLIMIYTLMDGMIRDMVHNTINIVIGEVQVHAPEYRDDRSFYKSLKDPQKILEVARLNGIGAAPRSYGFGLISVGTKSAGATFWGIDPSAERQTFDLAGHIQFGRFLDDQPQGGIVLGKKLARSLQASVGAEMIVVVQAADGSLGNELYTVVGILKTASDDIDRGAVILHQSDFQQLFVSGGRIHEIALNSFERMTAEEEAALIESAVPGEEVKTWKELIPIMWEMVSIMDAVIWIFAAIFFIAAGLGVMNTMLMATYDRMREFGILKAIGTSPWRIVENMAAEALVLSIAATILGTGLGLAASYYFQVVGIDTGVFAGSFSFSGIAWDPIWRSAITAKAVILPVVVMCIICTLASLYPAILAARLDPVRAIHHV